MSEKQQPRDGTDEDAASKIGSALDSSMDDTGDESNEDVPDGTKAFREEAARRDEHMAEQRDAAATDTGDTDTDAADAGEDTPESKTLAETGLLDDGEEFPWEGEEVGTDSQGRNKTRFTYKGPKEITEPEDPQMLENLRDMLDGVEDLREPERDRVARKYYKRLAERVITMDDHPIGEMFTVLRDDGRESYVHEDVLRTHGAITDDGTIAPEFRSEGGSDARIVAHWDGLTEFQQLKLGQKMSNFLDGEDQFLPRFG